MYKKRKLLTILAVSVLLAACSNAPETAESRADADAVDVSVAVAQIGSQKQLKDYTGSIAAETTSRIGTKIMGRIEALPWQEGDLVEKGDILFRVENGELQARKSRTESNLDQAQAHLENTQINFERITTLFEKGSATEKEKDDITAAYKSAKAQVSALEAAVSEVDKMLAQSVIRAPYDGYITQKFMQRGDIASPGRPIVALESFENLEVHARIPESDVAGLSVSDPVTVVIKAADLQVPGNIKQINPSSQFSRSQYLAIIDFTLPDSLKKNVKTGMYAHIIANQNGGGGVVVPAEALIHKGQLTGLFTVNSQDRASLRWVRAGSNTEGMVEILSGLRPGEEYITEYPGRLLEGQPVTITNRN